MADKFNISIDIGGEFEWLIGYDDNEGVLIVPGVTDIARMQVRTDFGVDPPVLDLATGSGIEFGLWTVRENVFNIKVLVSAVVTATLPEGKHVYDLEYVPLANESNAKRLVQGSCYISPNVTTP